ncbi:uncharacterized protein LAESUDRAFT_284186 [Laetiporus sulphureus 93-53]|uniref:Uncharacterized protein n=1 Tax=Laetiporus sulphureus 93-53 TaxID=1314785 RepID=A0A165DFT2_9APHY|nr:uncharacterized protein LAESUDRAFT_284186 [Laetiporus sulphureus 93-53]KZT04797.1 hypothetical protein LAESUDRAFT_284186 [Laetiporus sulphureus 93-53]
MLANKSRWALLSLCLLVASGLGVGAQDTSSSASVSVTGTFFPLFAALSQRSRMSGWEVKSLTRREGVAPPFALGWGALVYGPHSVRRAQYGWALPGCIRARACVLIGRLRSCHTTSTSTRNADSGANEAFQRPHRPPALVPPLSYPLRQQCQVQAPARAFRSPVRPLPRRASPLLRTAAASSRARQRAQAKTAVASPPRPGAARQALQVPRSRCPRQFPSLPRRHLCHPRPPKSLPPPRPSRCRRPRWLLLGLRRA